MGDDEEARVRKASESSFPMTAEAMFEDSEILSPSSLISVSELRPEFPGFVEITVQCFRSSSSSDGVFRLRASFQQFLHSIEFLLRRLQYRELLIFQFPVSSRDPAWTTMADSRFLSFSFFIALLIFISRVSVSTSDVFIKDIVISESFCDSFLKLELKKLWSRFPRCRRSQILPADSISSSKLTREASLSYSFSPNSFVKVSGRLRARGYSAATSILGFIIRSNLVMFSLLDYLPLYLRNVNQNNYCAIDDVHFISRLEILAWTNSTLQLNFSDVEEAKDMYQLELKFNFKMNTIRESIEVMAQLDNSNFLDLYLRKPERYSLQMVEVIYTLEDELRIDELTCADVRNEATRVMVTASLFAFVTTHILYLKSSQSDYDLRMKVCIGMGVIQLLIWAIWAWTRKWLEAINDDDELRRQVPSIKTTLHERVTGIALQRSGVDSTSLSMKSLKLLEFHTISFLLLKFFVYSCCLETFLQFGLMSSLVVLSSPSVFQVWNQWFILCEYNRDADFYRLPWSNKYHPELEDGLYPSVELRKLEIAVQEVFAVYCAQHYEGNILSTYMWQDESAGFLVFFLVKKDGSQLGQERRAYLQEGAWDNAHVFEVGPEEDGVTHYCLTSTIMLFLPTNDQSSGTFHMSGSSHLLHAACECCVAICYLIEAYDYLQEYLVSAGAVNSRGVVDEVLHKLLSFTANIMKINSPDMTEMIAKFFSVIMKLVDISGGVLGVSYLTHWVGLLQMYSHVDGCTQGASGRVFKQVNGLYCSHVLF